MAPFSKEDNILIKCLSECKGYNTLQFITEIPDKGLTKKQNQLAAGEGILRESYW